MLTILAALGVLLVIFFAAVVATREDQALLDAPGDVADVVLPDRPLHAADVHAVRFGVTIRGYRMAEVDQVLERLADELAARDRTITELAGPAPSPADLSPEPAEASPSPADVSPNPTDVTPAQSAMAASSLLDAPAERADPATPPRSSDEVSFPDVLPADPAGEPESAPRD